MKVELLSIDKIIPYENNPRFNDNAVDAVAESIKEYGFKVPLIVDKYNVIVTGHTRFKACIKLGMSKIPVVRADDLTDEQVTAFRLVDNKVAEFAEWDIEKLEIELDGIVDIDMSRFGFKRFDDVNIDNLFGDEEKEEKKPKTVKCPCCGEQVEI